MAKGLTRKQEIFCAEYAVDGNGTRAAVSAGYSAKSADSQSAQLLRLPKVQEEIKRRGQKLTTKLEISAEKVLGGLANLAFFDIRKLYDEQGNLKPITDLDDITASVIEGIEVEEAYEHFGKGQAKPKGVLKKVKLASRGLNLERLGRHLKLFTDKIEVSGLDELAERIAKARTRTRTTG